MTKVWPGSAPAGQLAVALVLCALSSAAVAQPAPSTVDSEAIRAVDRYLETWNSRNPMIWAGSLHFPHVRPGAGNFRLTRTPEEYARGVDFKRVLATGWHRSMWDSYDVVQHGPAKAHVAGRYSRYTEDGERIRTTFVTYVVTRQGDRWGVQSLFAAGPADVDPNQAAASELAALGAVETFFAALGNPTDPEAVAATLNYPHVRVADGAVVLWESAAQYLAGPEPGRLRTWAGTRLDWAEAVQVGGGGVNVVVRYSRLSPSGATLSSYEALYLVTTRDGHIGVQARSSFAP